MIVSILRAMPSDSGDKFVNIYRGSSSEIQVKVISIHLISPPQFQHFPGIRQDYHMGFNDPGATQTQ
jgi:hypothetical protein